jgi:hypothetical protein
MDILADLRANICEVTFTKNDGSERTMICTLIEDFLPFDDAKEELRIENALRPKDLVTVWDIEENGWRSFKPSRITNIEFSKE